MMWSIPTKKKAILSLTIGLCLSVFFMAGCNESAPPAKPAVVKKHIEQPSQTTPTEADKTVPASGTAAPQTKEAAAPAADSTPTQVIKGAEEKSFASVPKTTPPETAAKSGTATAEAAEPTTDTGQSSLKSSLLEDTTPRYDPAGKIDPFAALFSKESTADTSNNTQPKRPLTPLEKIDISQLQLVGVILAKSGNRAMVEDATGKPYLLKRGTYIGVNSGAVTKILKDRVIIEEKTKDFLGRVSTSTRELKLQKPSGEE